MRVDPKFYEAVAQEERNRLFAYLDFAEPVAACPVVTLTWRIYFELHLAGNAYVGTGEPKADDFFVFMWRMHPWFRRPDGSFPNLPAGHRHPPRWLCWLTKVALFRRALSVNLNVTEVEIRQRIRTAFQDAPHSSENEEETSPAQLTLRCNLYDSITAYFSHNCGYSRDAVLDSPIAWTLQILRAWRFQNDPKAAECYIPPSAKLLKFVD